MKALALFPVLLEKFNQILKTLTELKLKEKFLEEGE